jgi:hypothetical protein
VPMPDFVPASDNWEAIYYPNPIPLSSRTLLAMALLFDRVHLPGVSLPIVSASDDERSHLLEWVTTNPELESERNLWLWAIEFPVVADFIYLPDTTLSREMIDALHKPALQLLDDTYGEGTSEKVLALNAMHGIMPPKADGVGFALTWPFYQARALRYAAETNLPFVSDDPTSAPPLPPHPTLDADRAKRVAQQLAIEAVSLVLPSFRSVEPSQVAEFRSKVQPLMRPFRTEMVKLTSDVHTAMVSGSSDKELQALCRAIVETRVGPALSDLSKQLHAPLRPFQKVLIDIAEVGIAAASSTLSPTLTAGWALLRGAKIASEYVQAYRDKEGRRKSGLAYLLAISEAHGGAANLRSDWDKLDWRCSGHVDIADPDTPLTPGNREIADGPMKEWGVQVVRRLFQTKTTSAAQFIPNDRTSS